jgi:hypothetical protein
MGAGTPWREPLPPSLADEQSWLSLVEAHEQAPLVNVACTDHSLLLARLCRLLHERPELRFMSVASQLDEGTRWGV